MENRIKMFVCLNSRRERWKELNLPLWVCFLKNLNNPLSFPSTYVSGCLLRKAEQFCSFLRAEAPNSMDEWSRNAWNYWGFMALTFRSELTHCLFKAIQGASTLVSRILISQKGENFRFYSLAFYIQSYWLMQGSFFLSKKVKRRN